MNRQTTDWLEVLKRGKEIQDSEFEMLKRRAYAVLVGGTNGGY